MDYFYAGSMKCCLDGEKYFSIYNGNGAFCCEVSGYGDLPTIEEWEKSLSLEERERLLALPGYEAKCPLCGHTYFRCSEEYREEWPNSSDMAEGEAWEEHECPKSS